MSNQTAPALEIVHKGKLFILTAWYPPDGKADYDSKVGHETITREWQDENRTWLTIDEVYETRWDCMTARLKAAGCWVVEKEKK